MDRREFVKTSAAAGVCAVTPVAFGGKEITPQSGMGLVGFPDKIVSSFQYQDKVIVACEHSVWEMWTDHTGQFVKALISQF